MTPPQLDDYVSTQTMRYIGALKTQTGRSRFYVSFAQFAMIAILFYNDSPTIREVFPSVYLWAGALAVFGGVLMAVDYLAIYPAQITYNQGQAAREERSPLFKQVMENSRKLDDLHDQRQEAPSDD